MFDLYQLTPVTSTSFFMHKFLRYIYERECLIENNLKLLKTILTKPIKQAPQLIQRFCRPYKNMTFISIPYQEN